MSLDNKPQLNVNKKDITGIFDKRTYKTHIVLILFLNLVLIFFHIFVF